MFQPDNESEGFLEKTEDSTLRDDDNTQTLSFEITTHETLSPSPSQLAANEDLLSSSAPVFIPDKNENVSSNPNENTDENEKKEEKTDIFGSGGMKMNERQSPRRFQRAISTDPRIERNREEALSANFEDPLFPFLNPDLRSSEFKNSNSGSMSENWPHSASNSLQKNKWQISKGMSEANISPNYDNPKPSNNSMTVLNSSEVQPNQRHTSKKLFGSVNRKDLKRKISIASNLSSFGNYVFGSSIFAQNNASRQSVNSDNINYIVEPAGMFPSLLSLNSFEVAVEEEPVFAPSSHQRSVSAYNSRQNSGNDLQSLEKKRNLLQATVTSRGSSTSLSTRIFRDNDEKSAQDEESDKITEVKPIISRVQPPKKFWQQTMPDLEEGPESDTLTVQSTIRNNLAAAALAISVKEKMLLEKQKEQEKKEMEKKEPTQNVYLKNLFILCFAYFLSFASYMSLRNLQSSLHASGGLGMISLSCIYASLFFGSIVAAIFVQRMRPKFSIIVSFLGLLLYNIANYYPSFATLIPGSMSAGFSMAITWTAQGTYLANNALSSSKLSGKKLAEVLSFYQGVFFSAYQLAQMVGGIISSFIFSMQPSNQNHDFTNFSESSFIVQNYTNNSLLNTTEDITTSIYNFSISTAPSIAIRNFCGMYSCPGDESSETNVHIDQWLYLLMVSIFLCCVITSILVIAFFLNPLEGVIKKKNTSVTGQLTCVFKICTEPNMLTLFPLMSYSLLQTTFMFGEFNKAFVTCVIGIHMVGYMTVFLSLFSSIMAFCGGNLQKYLGIEAIIALGLIVQLVLTVILWFWSPSKNELIYFFVFVSFWGLADGMIMAQIISLLGTLFMDRKEAAFAAYKMVQSASAFIMFIIGPYVCTKTKVVVLMAICVLAMLGLVMLKVKQKIEVSIRVDNKKSMSSLNVKSQDNGDVKA